MFAAAFVISAFQPAVHSLRCRLADEVTEAFVAAWSQGDLDALDAVVAPDFLVHDPPGPDIVGARCLQGHSSRLTQRRA